MSCPSIVSKIFIISLIDPLIVHFLCFSDSSIKLFFSSNFCENSSSAKQLKSIVGEDSKAMGSSPFIVGKFVI
uniref:Uncharacterized protein n=1 Tax=Iridovirus sp. TaxID=135728 RepID=A0AAU7YEK8_9VIRU